MPAFMTSDLALIRTTLNSEVSATVLAAWAKAAALPFASFTTTSSGRRFSPTRSYWKAFHFLSLAASSAAGRSEATTAASRVGLKKVFSWRY